MSLKQPLPCQSSADATPLMSRCVQVLPVFTLPLTPLPPLRKQEMWLVVRFSRKCISPNRCIINSKRPLIILFFKKNSFIDTV